MRQLGTRGRRKFAAAFAGLSVVLVGVFSPLGMGFASDDAEPAPLNAENAGAIIDADAIASGRVTKASNLTDAGGVGKGLLSGHVYMADPNGNMGANYDNGLRKLDGITVYAQFLDKDGSYSPIFSAQTHTLPDVVGGNGGKGTYAFGIGNQGMTWTDRNGKEHIWQARTYQQHRIWVEPYTSENGNPVQMIRVANGFVPGSFNTPAKYPLGSFVASDLNLQLTAVFLQELAPNHQSSYMAATGDRLIEDPKGPIASAAGQLGESNVLSGRVWLETGGADGGIVATGPSKNGSDPAASGYTVYASTLTKEGAAANESLRAQFKDDPARLASETKKLLEANPQYILKTVYGKTDKDGYYSLRFGEYTNASQTREDFLNRDHVFLWVENQDGVVQKGYTGFNTPVFQRFDSGGGFRPAAIPAENQTVTSRVEDIGNPRYGKPVNSLYNVNYAIMPYEPAYITTDYNATDNPAAQGDTVTPTLTGNISSLPTQLEWRDKTGKVLKTCEIDPTQSAEDQVKACTFDIPAEAETGDMFSAVLVSGGNDVSGSSVIVLNYVPEYADTTVAAGLTASVTPTFSRGEAANLEAPKGTKFAFDPNFAAPAWLSIDPDTGVITVAPGIDVDPVELDVPVVVTYAKGGVANATAKVKVVASSDSDGDGVPDPVDPQNPQPGEDICPDTPAGAKVDADGCAVAPSVGDVPEVTGKKGEEITPVVVPVDNSGMATDVTCKVVGLPEGLSVVYDEAQGGCVISGVPGEDTVKDQSFTVTVEFNRPDGDKSAGVPVEKDGVVNITLPAIPIDPETPVTDSDGDGVPDPKDPQNPQPGEDLCVDTPAGETVDENGCSLSQLYEPAYPDTEVEAGKEASVTPTFTKKDEEGNVEAPTGTTFAFDPDFEVPDWADIDPNTGVITLKPGVDEAAQTITFPVVVTYPDNGGTDKVNAVISVTAAADSDGDGVPDVNDQCVNTPAGAEVDANGCAVAPTVGDVAPIQGQVNTAIEPITVPIENPGMATDLVCSAEGLPAGLEIALNEDGTACVISGTPTEAVTDQPVTVKVGYTPADGEDPQPGEVTTETTATINPEDDSDGDGVPDSEDLCADTPAGAEVDADGCAVAPSVGEVAPIQGQVNTAIEPITVPIENPGMATDLVCSAEGLPAGLEIALNEDGTACVISGTPTEAVTDQPVTVKVGFTPADKDNPNQGPATTDTTATIIAADPTVVAPEAPNFWAPNAEDPTTCEIAPYVTVAETEGVVYKVTVDGTELQPNLEGKYVYEWGQTVVVTASPAEGYAFPEDVDLQTEWTWTADKPAFCLDDDNDGVPNSEDLCENTPEGAEVDENGCAVAPTVPEAPKIDGEVNKPIDPIEVPINNPGMATDLVCSAEGLPAGLTIELNEDGTACVISGTPTEAIDGEYTIIVDSNKPDGDNGKNEPGKNTGEIVVTDGDDDNDGVPNSEDLCENTPEGAEVDENGCAVAPTVPEAPKIDGEVNKPIDPIEVPINNPGKATDLVCSAEGLPEGLTIELNEDGTACVISGTPKAPIDGDYTMTIGGKSPDSGEAVSGSNTGKIKVTETVAEPSKPTDQPVKPGKDGLAKTGVEIAGLAGIAAALMAAGVLLVLRKRREN